MKFIFTTLLLWLNILAFSQTKIDRKAVVSRHNVRLTKADTLASLLMPIRTNTYLPNGHNYQDDRLRLYLPGNGGVLVAVALMCVGDTEGGKNQGFPKNG